MVPLWCDLRLKLIASIRYEIAEAQQRNYHTRRPPHLPLHSPSEGYVHRAEVAAGCDTLSHCDTFHFTVVWFENKYENSFHLPAKKEFHWVSLLFSHFLSLPYLSIFMHAVCLVLPCRIVLYRVVSCCIVSCDWPRPTQALRTHCLLCCAGKDSPTVMASERESHTIIRIYVDDYCIECISTRSAVI